MWGFEILRKGGSIADANRHFAIALESKRKREYVRHMQISALLWTQKPELESEAIRVANEMRIGGESMPAGTPEGSDTWRLWNIYYSRLISGRDKPQFLATLSRRTIWPRSVGSTRRISSRSRSTIYTSLFSPSCRSSTAIAPMRWPPTES